MEHSYISLLVTSDLYIPTSCKNILVCSVSDKVSNMSMEKLSSIDNFNWYFWRVEYIWEDIRTSIYPPKRAHIDKFLTCIYMWKYKIPTCWKKIIITQKIWHAKKLTYLGKYERRERAKGKSDQMSSFIGWYKFPLLLWYLK